MILKAAVRSTSIRIDAWLWLAAQRREQCSLCSAVYCSFGAGILINPDWNGSFRFDQCIQLESLDNTRCSSILEKKGNSEISR